MNIQKFAYQDGAQFYDVETGNLLVEYKELVAHDFDVPGAENAREAFRAEFPSYVIEGEDGSEDDVESAVEAGEHGKWCACPSCTDNEFPADMEEECGPDGCGAKPGEPCRADCAWAN